MADSVLRLFSPYLMRSHWQMSDEEWEYLYAISKQPVLPASLPVAALSKAMDELYKGSTNPVASRSGTQIDILDATIRLPFRWRRELPRYVGDIDVYVRQPFDRFPELDTVQLLVLSAQDPQARRVVMACSSSDVMGRIESVFCDTKGTYVTQAVAPSVHSQLFTLLQVVFGCMRTDILEFILQFTYHLNQMVEHTLHIQNHRCPC